MPNVFVHQAKKGEGSKKGNEEKQEAAELVTDGNCCDTFFSETQLYTITHNYEQLHTKLHTGEKTLIDMATWGQVCDQYECMNVILAKLLIFVSFSKALYAIVVFYIPSKAGRWQLFQSSNEPRKTFCMNYHSRFNLQDNLTMRTGAIEKLKHGDYIVVVFQFDLPLYLWADSG